MMFTAGWKTNLTNRKALTCFVLVCLLVSCFAGLYTVPSVRAYTGTITYNSGTDIITAVGGNSSVPITFYDLYLADVAGGWGQVFLQGNTQFWLNAKLFIGDGSTATYFADINKQIVLNGTGTANPIRITNNAVFRSGELVDATNRISKNGCSFIKTSTDTATMLFRPLSASAYLYLYSSSFTNLGAANTIYCVYAGAPVVYNSQFIGWKTISVVPDAAPDFYNIVVEAGQSSIENVGGDLSLFSLGNSYGITYSLTTNVASKNIVIKNASTAAILAYQVSGSPALINAVLSDWSISWSGTCTGKVYRQYEYDLSVLNGEITEFVENANVTLTKGGAIIGSWLTNSSGQISTQVLTYGYYNQTYGNTLQDGVNPFVLTVTHPDWANYTSRFYITQKTQMTISMQEPIETGVTEQEAEDNMIFAGFICALVACVVMVAFVFVKRKSEV